MLSLLCFTVKTWAVGTAIPQGLPAYVSVREGLRLSVPSLTGETLHLKEIRFNGLLLSPIPPAGTKFRLQLSTDKSLIVLGCWQRSAFEFPLLTANVLHGKKLRSSLTTLNC